jgi:hypothetical protein
MVFGASGAAWTIAPAAMACPTMSQPTGSTGWIALSGAPSASPAASPPPPQQAMMRDGARPNCAAPRSRRALPLDHPRIAESMDQRAAAFGDQLGRHRIAILAGRW